MNLIYKQSCGNVARIGRYSNNILSPLFGKFFVDIKNRTGKSDNLGVPESFNTKADAIAFLEKFGFKKAE